MLVHAFDQALRLLHPVVPFVTESLWQQLPGHLEGEFLARAPWPARGELTLADRRAAAEFELVRDAVLAVRQLRADNDVPPGKMIDVILRPSENNGRDAGNRALFEREAALDRATHAE